MATVIIVLATVFFTTLSLFILRGAIHLLKKNREWSRINKTLVEAIGLCAEWLIDHHAEAKLHLQILRVNSLSEWQPLHEEFRKIVPANIEATKNSLKTYRPYWRLSRKQHGELDTIARRLGGYQNLYRKILADGAEFHEAEENLATTLLNLDALVAEVNRHYAQLTGAQRHTLSDSKHALEAQSRELKRINTDKRRAYRQLRTALLRLEHLREEIKGDTHTPEANP